MALLILVVIVAVIAVALNLEPNARAAGRASCAVSPKPRRGAARRRVERLGASIVNLDNHGDVAAHRAMADASERLTAATSQPATAGVGH